MSSTATSNTVDNSYAIDWVEKIVDQMRHNIYAGLAEIATGKVKVPRYKIDRNAHPKIVVDDRIELTENRKEILERCLLMLADGKEPVLSDDDVAFFLQMNFKGFGDVPDERVKLEYNMKPTHLMSFFRLVYDNVYFNKVSDTELRAFREAVANSFVGFDSVKPDTIVTYFSKVKPAIKKVYTEVMKNIRTEY